MVDYNKLIRKIEEMLQREKDEHKYRNYWIVYSALFLILICLVFSSFYINGKSFIWKVDGINQHYPALLYLGQYLREFIKNLLQGTFHLPLWDLKIGMGADILTTLNYYSFGDPLDLIAVFFKSTQIEYCYNILVILRIYFAGIVFSKFCFELKKSRFQTLIGCIVYVFCGYMMIAVRHPFFINAMIYLPLTLIGVERVFKKKGSKLFIFSIVLTAISNFYFLYMITIFAVLYAVIKYIYDVQKKSISFFFRLLGRFACRYILAIGLSAVIFFPVLIAFFDNPRGVADSNTNLLFYNLNYYLSLIPDMLKTETYGYWTATGISSIALISVILLFTIRKGKQSRLKIAFTVMTAFLIFPVFGLLFNGFSYISNRWVFAYTFLLSMITVEMVPVLLSLNNKRKRIIQICSILLGIYFISLPITRTIENLRSYAIFIIMMATICLLKGKIICKKMVLLLLTGASVVSLSYGYYAVSGGSAVSQFMDRNEAYKNIISSPQTKVLKLNDSSIYRVQDKEMKNGNFGLVSKVNTTTSFFSLTGGNLVTYSNSLANAGMKAAFQLKGFENRASLLSLAAVKYMVLNDNTSKAEVPYGFKKIKKYSARKIFGGKENGSVYKNKYCLPIGYVYQNVYTLTDYKKLDYGYREQVQTGAAILKEKVNGIPEYYVDNNQKELIRKTEILKQLDKNKNIKYKNGKLYVSKNDVVGTVKIPMEEETYLQIKGLRFENRNFLKEQLNEEHNMNRIKRNFLKQKASNWEPVTETILGFYTSDYNGGIKLRTDEDRYFFGQRDFLVDLGNKSKKEKIELKIKFAKAGIYTVNDIKVFGKSMKKYKENMSLLQNNSMKNVHLETNKITGNVNLKKKGVLCLAVPYNKGWRVKVNGEIKKIHLINELYMGVVLDEGNSQIIFEYETPGLKEGVLVSAFSIILSMILYLISKYKNSVKKK